MSCRRDTGARPDSIGAPAQIEAATPLAPVTPVTTRNASKRLASVRKSVVGAISPGKRGGGGGQAAPESPSSPPRPPPLTGAVSFSTASASSAELLLSALSSGAAPDRSHDVFENAKTAQRLSELRNSRKSAYF